MSASFHSSRAVPSLRDSCDTNVQVAFSEGRWPTVVTLAKNQFKRTRDPYYEAVELAARSKLESPIDQRAALAEVEKILAENGKVKDYWTLDLYEWACQDVENDYSKTIGLLRASYVKDVWKATDKDAVKAAKLSFHACVVNDDWVNAQKIVAILDQKFPKESRYYFSNVLAYYISSSKLPPSDPKRAMFKTLAKRLIDKARELGDNVPAPEGYPPRAINSEEEMRLWLEINVKSAETKAEVFALLKKPEFDPLKRLSEGYVSVFKDIMSLLEEHEVWDDIFTISQEVLTRGTNLLTETETGAKKEAEARAIRSAVMDWSLWKQFIHAAGHLQDEKRALEQLHTYSSELSKNAKLPRIIQKQLDLANLWVLFGRHRPNIETAVSDTEQTSNARIDQLVAYVASNYSLVSCFDDLKPYLEQLSFGEITCFLEQLGKEGEKETNDVFQNTIIITLRLRFRYMFITSPKSLEYQRDGGVPKCRFCNSVTPTSNCITCLKSIAESCVWTYNAGFDDRDLRTRINSEDVDPFAEIAIIGATCLLKLARFGSQPSYLKTSATHSVDLKLLLQAIAWLNSHYSRVPQKNQGMPVLLTKLYLLIGCVSHAKELWDSLEVKNVTLDSLGPLFSDRLSSIAPGMWRASGRTPMYPYHKHYTDAIRTNIPTNIRTSLEHGNYTSVLGLLRARDRLSRSCTMVMSNVEDRRGLRAIGSKFALEVKADPLLRKISGDIEFINVTDTAALPNHEHSPSTLADFIGIGPGLSDLRAKLSFHTEDFISLISYKDAKDFKPTKGAQVAEFDRMYLSESAEKISRALSAPFIKCLEAADGPASTPVVTVPELSYFTVINFLNRFVAVSTKAQWTKSSPRPTAVSTAIASVVSSLERQSDALNAGAPPEQDAVLLHFASLHGLGMLRESAVAVKLTVACLERATAPVPKGDVPKWLGEDLKALAGAAGEAAAVVKRRIQALNQAAGVAGWLDTIARFAFGGLADGSRTVPAEAPANAAEGDLETMVFVAAGRSAGLEQTIGEIKDSWQSVAKGWAAVKLD